MRQSSRGGLHQIWRQLSQNPVLPRIGRQDRALHHHDECGQVWTLHRSPWGFPDRFLCSLFSSNVKIPPIFDIVMTRKQRSRSAHRSLLFSITAMIATISSSNPWAEHIVSPCGSLVCRRKSRQILPSQLCGGFALSHLRWTVSSSDSPRV